MNKFLLINHLSSSFPRGKRTSSSAVISDELCNQLLTEIATDVPISHPLIEFNRSFFIFFPIFLKAQLFHFCSLQFHFFFQYSTIPFNDFNNLLYFCLFLRKNCYKKLFFPKFTHREKSVCCYSKSLFANRIHAVVAIFVPNIAKTL